MAFGAPRDGADDELPLSAEINVTPFIDVMLVLLIIFMVTAPLLVQGIAVELPKAAVAKPLERRKPVVVTVTADGQLQVGDRFVALEGLLEAVRTELAGEEDRAIQIRGDREARYASVVAAMDALYAGGLSRFVLLLERRPGGP